MSLYLFVNTNICLRMHFCMYMYVQWQAKQLQLKLKIVSLPLGILRRCFYNLFPPNCQQVLNNIISKVSIEFKVKFMTHLKVLIQKHYSKSIRTGLLALWNKLFLKKFFFSVPFSSPFWLFCCLHLFRCFAITHQMS